MKGTQLAIRFALSPAGAAIDRFCVRSLGHSPVVWLFTRSDDSTYNPPLVLTTTGRKTGRPRDVVLPYFEVGEGRIAIDATASELTDERLRELFALPGSTARAEHG